MEGLLRSLIHSAERAVETPTDYEARSNIMWIATWALNTLVAKGKSTDWEVHMDRAGCRRAHRRHARHDAFGGLHGLLQTHSALWAG